MNIFDTRGTLVALLKAMIDREVAQTCTAQMFAPKETSLTTCYSQ